METTDITLPVLVAVTALPGAMFWRANSGTFLTPDGKRYVKAQSIAGVADIIGLYFGRFVAIETKAKRGALRKTQENFRDQVLAKHGAYIVIRPTADTPVEQIPSVCGALAVDALMSLPMRFTDESTVFAEYTGGHERAVQIGPGPASHSHGCAR